MDASLVTLLQMIQSPNVMLKCHETTITINRFNTHPFLYIYAALQAQIMTTVTPSNIVINRDAQFTCDITSANPDIDVEATIQWLGPNGTVLAESGPNDNSLDLDFEPFRLSDVGDYTCTAKVSSPDLPSSIMSVISRTISFTRKPSITLHSKYLWLTYYRLVSHPGLSLFFCSTQN